MDFVYCYEIQETWGWTWFTVMKYKKPEDGFCLLLWNTRNLRMDFAYCNEIQETWGWTMVYCNEIQETWGSILFTVIKYKQFEVGLGSL